MKTIVFLIGVDILGFPIIHKHNFKEVESSFSKENVYHFRNFNSTIMHAIKVKLAQEELEQLENLAGSGYSLEQIAMYLEVPKAAFIAEYFDLDSLIHYHYQRGILVVDAEAGMKLAENARSGNITAHQQLLNIRRAQFVDREKNELSMAKKLLDYNLDDLYEWLENGKSALVDESFMRYVELLDKVRAMMLRKDIYGNKETIIKHLITFEPELQKNKYRANQIYSESIEYFYTQDTISKKAWRNLYADDLDKAYDLAIALAETSSDVEKATKIKERAGKIRALDQVDPPEIPKNLFSRPNKVYSMDMDMWEIGSEDRNDAVAWIEEYGKKLSLKQIDRIKQDMGAKKITIFQDEAEDPRKE